MSPEERHWQLYQAMQSQNRPALMDPEFMKFLMWMHQQRQGQPQNPPQESGFTDQIANPNTLGYLLRQMEQEHLQAGGPKSEFPQQLYSIPGGSWNRQMPTPAPTSQSQPNMFEQLMNRWQGDVSSQYPQAPRSQGGGGPY